MKKVFIIIFGAILLLLPQSISAHLVGQPPFFLVNGTYSQLYYVPLTSLSDFNLPQDQSPGNYLVGQNINFAFDVNRLPAPPDVVKKTTFSWDFGDGSTTSGLSATHTYDKMGSYILAIKAYDGTTPTPQLIESVLLNILPNKDYQLPKAVILINGRMSKDPLTDVLDFPLTNSINLDASNSTGNIVSYFWDLGDQQSSNQKTLSHTYRADSTQIFPVLRVKDSNGFLSDNFVEVENKNQSNFNTNSSQISKTDSQTFNFKPILIILAILILAIMARLSVRGRYHGRR